MRKDMYKIICERPRFGGKAFNHHPYRQAKHVMLIDGDCYDKFSGRTKVPMKPTALDWDDYKSFNDYLSPLYRFIEKQVGRPWDDVYSEICENITLDSTTRRHVREHVDRHVEVNVRFNEYGDPCVLNKWNYGLSPLSKGDLYKDPNDGILKKAAFSKKKEADHIKRQQQDREKAFIRERSFNNGITFRWENTGERHKRYNGETAAWFKYHYIHVRRTRSIVIDYTEIGSPIYRHEEYIERIRVRDTASKKEIRDYKLND